MSSLFPDSQLFKHSGPSAKSETMMDSSRAQRALGSLRDPIRDISPMPIVSDIIMSAAAPARTPLPALKPSHPERRPADQVKPESKAKGKKRARSPLGADSMPVTKKRKGEKREIPCVKCVRRLANDPQWSCHDAVVGQTGSTSYTGNRCRNCVAQHVSCRMIPPSAEVPVRALVKAAADMIASNGHDKVVLRAVFEAAIGPALQAIVRAPATDMPPKQRRKSKKSSSVINPAHHSATAAAAAAASKRPKSGRLQTGGKTSHHKTNGHLSGAEAPPSQPRTQINSQHATQGPPPSSIQSMDYSAAAAAAASDFERLEQQALRRRKVEALESLAHTAALFLAEFMTFTRQYPSAAAATAAASSASPAMPNGMNGAGSSSEGMHTEPSQSHGASFAAAAAASTAAAEMATTLFRPLMAEDWRERTMSEDKHDPIREEDLSNNNNKAVRIGDDEQQQQDENNDDSDIDSESSTHSAGRTLVTNSRLVVHYNDENNDSTRPEYRTADQEDNNSTGAEETDSSDGDDDDDDDDDDDEEEGGEGDEGDSEADLEDGFGDDQQNDVEQRHSPVEPLQLQEGGSAKDGSVHEPSVKVEDEE